MKKSSKFLKITTRLGMNYVYTTLYTLNMILWVQIYYYSNRMNYWEYWGSDNIALGGCAGASGSLRGSASTSCGFGGPGRLSARAFVVCIVQT